MNKKIIRFILLALVLLSVVVTGCSNTEKKSVEEKPTLMEDIKKRGKFIVATEADFAPFAFIENGKMVGYGPDILNEITKSLNIEVEQLDLPFSGILPGLEAKKFDFVASSINVTPERIAKYSFTAPIAENSAALIKRKDDDSMKSINDINGKVIGSQIDSVPEKILRKYNETLKANGFEGFKEIKQYQSLPEADLDLKNGRIDLVAQSLPTINVLMLQQPDTFEVVDTFGDKLYMAWVVRKEDTELLNILNTEILKLKQNGKLAELQIKWFGVAWDLPDTLE